MRGAAARARVAEAPRVSVALCTYNGERHLEDQLRSLADQTLAPLEIVVCDDGSTDGTEAIVRAFAARARMPVRWSVNPERRGYRRNFVGAGPLCRGELIAFCDQDDVWRADKLAVASAPFADHDVLMTYHQVDLMGPAGEALGPYRDRAPRVNPFTAAAREPWLFGLGFTLMFRRALLGHDALIDGTADFNGRAETLAHDQWYFFLASVLGRVVYIDQSLARYRQHDRNLFGARLGAGRPGLPYATRMRHRYERNADHHAACVGLARTLSRLVETVEPAHRGEVLAARARYERLARRFRWSMSLCEGRSPAPRLASALRLLADGGYAPGARWSFEDRSLPRDLLACFAAGPFEAAGPARGAVSP